MAVPYRNRKLFCCVFWSHRHIECVNKGGAHIRFVDLLDVHSYENHVWAPFTEVQRYGASNPAMWSNRWGNNLGFLHWTVTHTNLTARGGDMPSPGIKHMYKWWITGVAIQDYGNTCVPWVPQSHSQASPICTHQYIKMGRPGNEARCTCQLVHTHPTIYCLYSPSFIYGNFWQEFVKVNLLLLLSDSVTAQHTCEPWQPLVPRATEVA